MMTSCLGSMLVALLHIRFKNATPVDADFFKYRGKGLHFQKYLAMCGRS